MRLFDVCTKKIFEKDGEQKVKWYKAGTMKTTEKGNTYLRLFHQPENEFFIFEKSLEPKLETIQIEN